MKKIEIEFINDLTRYRDLQNAWKQISVDSAESPLYTQPVLLAKWWESFGNDIGRPILMRRGLNIAGESCSAESLYVLVARTEGKIIGILPLMLLKAKPHGVQKSIRVLTFLGDFIFNPAPTVQVMRGYEEVVCRAAAEFIAGRDDWDACLLYSVRDDFSNLAKLLTHFSSIFRESYSKKKVGEVLFLKYWDRAQVCRSLRALAIKSGNEKNRIDAFVENIEKMSQSEFTMKCLSQITPQLKHMLTSLRELQVGAEFWIQRIYDETVQVIPYEYQIVDLPLSTDEFQMSLTYKKRYELKNSLKDAQVAGFQIDVQSSLSDDDFMAFTTFHRSRFPRSVHLSDLTLSYYKDTLSFLAAQNSLFWAVVRSSAREPVFFGMFFYDRFMQSMDFVIPGSKRTDINFGDLCVMQLIEKSIQLGCRCFSFRMGGEKYKERFNPRKINLLAALFSKGTEIDLKNMLPRNFVICEEPCHES